MGKVKWWAVTFLIFLSTNHTHACSTPPPQYTKHHVDLIRDTSRIVLARVTGASGDFLNAWGRIEPIAQFETIEIVKGHVPDSFSIENGYFVPGQPFPAQDFDSHTQLGFWEKQVTRQWNMPDCTMRPAFLEDRTYLLFLDAPHWRAYEEVSDADDLWLGAVRRLVADPDLDMGLNLSAQEWLSMAHGVFLGKVSNCSGPTLEVNRVFSGVFEDEWAYTNNQHSRYWPFPGCSVGESFFVVTMADEQSALPYYSSSVFEVSDGVVDLSVRRGSEVKVAPGRLELDAIEGTLR